MHRPRAPAIAAAIPTTHSSPEPAHARAMAPQAQPPPRLDSRGASPDDRRNVSPWRSTGLVSAALLLACTKPNPAFDPDARASASASASESAGPASEAGTTAPPTSTNTGASTDTSGSISATGHDSSTTDDPTSALTSSTTDDPTTGPGCGQIGEPCGASDCCRGCGLCMAGTCMPDSSSCGPCKQCGDDSECAPMPPMTPCKLADDPCAGKTWGLDDGVCFANAPADGTCDPQGACQAPPSCDKGAPIVTCDAVCIIDPANCAADVPVAQVDANLLCAQDGPTPPCDATCVDGEPDDRIEVSTCKQGVCQIVKSTSCGNYVCKTPDACPDNCMGMADCKPGHFCDGNQCK